MDNNALTTVLGIDPGLDRTGWAILTRDKNSNIRLTACGLIHSSKDSALPERLEYIFNEIGKLAEAYKPNHVAMEEMFFLKRAITVSQTIQTRGVILLAAHLKGLNINSYSPKKVKSVICGSGTAGKAQIQRMVQLTLKLTKKPEPDDVADAIAIGICHLKTAPLKEKINLQAEFLAKINAAKQQQIKKK
ncbi:Crossover junction endodeoxyribonuclease RuvC [Elusimicrobium minutum Pei191]|uniref:Crossover junction endodeoxyribonuclease RuvC n=1 Tax=Elusimicrobium minutum (strain Pei191) TaxID=445932 RepID=B2KDV8_ELUMP|nr:crossover junction endodeoxyribonuclease RuvC [Elusimicrobium minutum]ACC98704.1 Crossover junction endodeoxyribonuclease RuvC [Elusimicrobium minutum Pei191]